MTARRHDMAASLLIALALGVALDRRHEHDVLMARTQTGVFKEDKVVKDVGLGVHRDRCFSNADCAQGACYINLCWDFNLGFGSGAYCTKDGWVRALTLAARTAYMADTALVPTCVRRACVRPHASERRRVCALTLVPTVSVQECQLQRGEVRR